MFLAKKWGVLIKKESGSLIFTGLKIPRDYFIDEEVEHEKEKGTFIVSNDTDSESNRKCVEMTHGK